MIGVPVFSCRWVHIGCAVAMPEVFFLDVHLREGIDMGQIPQARRKLVSNTSTLFSYLLLPNLCDLRYVLFIHRSVSTVERIRWPAERITALAYSVAQESAQFLST